MAEAKAAPRRVSTRIKDGLRRRTAKVRSFFANFSDGDGVTKASYLVMGLSHLRRGQVGRGLIYLAAEILFILYMILFG